MTDKEIELLAHEVTLLKEVLYEKEFKLKDNCQHKKIKRGTDSLYYYKPFEALNRDINGYTYVCKLCGSRWKFDKPDKEFEKRIND